jgi:integrase
VGSTNGVCKSYDRGVMSSQEAVHVSLWAGGFHCAQLYDSPFIAFTFDRFKESRIEEGVSPAGVNRDLALPRAAFNFAVERRMLVHNPLDGVKLFNEAKHRKPPRTISFPEEQRILMCCDARLRLIVTVLLYTGMRVGIEALRLKWSDVDFDESIITVAQSKTAAGLRALPMTAFVASELQKMARQHERNIRVRLFQPATPEYTYPQC